MKSKKSVIKGEFNCEIIDVVEDQEIQEGEII
jgi:hypothetical protein